MWIVDCGSISQTNIIYLIAKNFIQNPQSSICNLKSSIFAQTLLLVKKLVLALICCCTLFSASAQTGYWQQELQYKISVKLNDHDQSLDAFESIQYTNHSPDTLLFIWFHLWPNAFKNDRTAFSEQMLQNGDTKLFWWKRLPGLYQPAGIQSG